MDRLVKFFSSDATVLAVVNVAAIAAGIVLVFQLLRWIVRLSIWAYHSSVKQALVRSRLRYRNSVKFYSNDVYAYIGHVAYRLCVVTIACTGILIQGIAVIYSKVGVGSSLWTMEPFGKLGYTDLITGVASLSMLAVVGWNAIGLSLLTRDVVRRRTRRGPYV